jgi:hypothetical protein
MEKKSTGVGMAGMTAETIGSSGMTAETIDRSGGMVVQQKSPNEDDDGCGWACCYCCGEICELLELLGS